MRIIGFNEDGCRANLQCYLGEIEEIMTLVTNPRSMSRAQVQEAQTLLRNLKSCLRRDYKRRDTAKGRAQMTKIEAAFFAPAIEEAYANLGVRVDSRPSQMWVDDLAEMEHTFEYYLRSLKEHMQSLNEKHQ